LGEYANPIEIGINSRLCPPASTSASAASS
jgi:hypothetical protein